MTHSESTRTSCSLDIHYVSALTCTCIEINIQVQVNVGWIWFVSVPLKITLIFPQNILPNGEETNNWYVPWYCRLANFLTTRVSVLVARNPDDRYFVVIKLPLWYHVYILSPGPATEQNKLLKSFRGLSKFRDSCLIWSWPLPNTKLMEKYTQLLNHAEMKLKSFNW